MKKKVFACTLVMATILGSSLTAFAADTTISDMAGAGEGAELTGTSTVKLPTISVTVPTSADITINPFQMEFETDETEADGSTKKKSTAAIYSATQEISSDSDVDIVVNVENLLATPSDGITLTAKAVTTGTKQLYLSLDVTDDANKVTSVVIPGAASDPTKSKPAAKTGLATLKANKNGDADDDTKATFKITGSAVANPTKTVDRVVSADPWTSSDKVDIAMKFTFTPQVVKAGN